MPQERRLILAFCQITASIPRRPNPASGPDRPVTPWAIGIGRIPGGAPSRVLGQHVAVEGARVRRRGRFLCGRRLALVAETQLDLAEEEDVAVLDRDTFAAHTALRDSVARIEIDEDPALGLPLEARVAAAHGGPTDTQVDVGHATEDGRVSLEVVGAAEVVAGEHVEAGHGGEEPTPPGRIGHPAS